MKRFVLSCAAIALALVSPVSPVIAAGESPSPELDRFYLRLASGPRELSRMVQCLINQNPEAARQLFDHDIFSAEYNRAASEFGKHGSNCLFNNSDLRASGLMYIGAIAEQLIAKDRPVRPTKAAWQFGSNLQVGGGKHLWTWRNLTPAASSRMLPLAYCLLERDPEQVESVFGMRQTSDGERKLFNAMNDKIDGCIPASETWTLQPQLFRAALAVAYYHSARATSRREPSQQAN